MIAVCVILVVLVVVLSLRGARAGTTLTITSTNDTSDFAIGDGMCDTDDSIGDGPCTLRAAMEEANAASGSDAVVIEFNIPASSDLGCSATTGLCTISPSSSLPALARANITIDGTTQPGSSCGNVIDKVPSVLQVRLRQSTGNRNTDLTLLGGHSAVRGLAIGVFSFQETDHAVELSGEGNSVECNELTGSVYGVHVMNGSRGNIVQGNIIHGNETGLLIESSASENIVRRNVFGGTFAGRIESGHEGVCGGGSRYGFFCASDADCPGNECTVYGNGWAISVAGSHNTIGGEESDRNYFSGPSSGVMVRSAAEYNNISHNYFGFTQDGVVERRLQDPIIINGARNTVQYNTIQGNQLAGVLLENGATDNVVRGNKLIDNGTGIFINNAADNTLVDNVIGGSWGNGVHLFGSATTGNLVQHNKIGVDASGQAIPNGQQGVLIYDAHNNAIDNNTLAHNVGSGISIIGDSAIGNGVLSNAIYANGQGGIRLGNGGSGNDLNDVDNGPNNYQNYPIITGSTILDSTTEVAGTLNSEPNSNYRLEFFGNEPATEPDTAQGQTYLGFTRVTTNTTGNISFSLTNLPAITFGQVITATASKEEPGGYYSTSEFSPISKARRTNPPTTLVVTSIGDGSDTNIGDGLCDDGGGQCTLRAAIEESNALSDLDTINFKIPGNGAHLVRLESDLPDVIDRVIIDGTTQPESLCEVGVWNIVIDANSYSGLNLSAGNSTVKGLEIKNARGKDVGAGLTLSSGNNIVQCLYLHDSQIGLMVGGSTNIIGGTTPNTRNVISGNTMVGLAVVDTGKGATSNVIQGNAIGVSSDNRSANGNGYGIIVLMGASHNTIGGTESGAGNVIANNVTGGVYLVAPDIKEVTSGGVGNTILGNSIYNNGSLGISFSGATATLNDATDTDTGPNNLQNYPTLTRAVGFKARTVVSGKLQSIPNQTFRLEFFWTPGSGSRQGKIFIGAKNVTTNRRGLKSFAARDLIILPGTGVITATATDSDGNTSEFSAPVEPRLRFTSTPQQETALERELMAEETP